VEDKKPYGQIYAIIDPFCEQLGGKVQYIGKHKFNETKDKTLQESLERYLNYCFNGAQKNKRPNRLYDIYMRSVFKDLLNNVYNRPKIEQVEVCYSERELNNREEYWRQFFLNFYPDLLNMMPGGLGGSFKGGLVKKENRERWIMNIKNALKGKVPWNKGLSAETDKRVAESAKKQSESQKGKISWSSGLTKETDERIEKMSKSIRKTWTKEKRQHQSKILTANPKRIGKNHPMYGISPRERMNSEIYEQWRKNISKSNKGRTPWNKGLSAETDKRVAESNKHQSENRQKNKDKYLGKQGWSKGLTKETDKRIENLGKSISKSIMSNSKERKFRSDRVKGENNPRAKLTNIQVIEIREKLNFCSEQDLSKEYQVSIVTIRKIKRGKYRNGKE
jgi:nitrate/nitrite-specific signal transduction histidine kinase